VTNVNSPETVENTSARTNLRQSMQKLTIRFHWLQILQDTKANPFVVTTWSKSAKNFNS